MTVLAFYASVHWCIPRSSVFALDSRSVFGEPWSGYEWLEFLDGAVLPAGPAYRLAPYFALIVLATASIQKSRITTRWTLSRIFLIIAEISVLLCLLSIELRSDGRFLYYAENWILKERWNWPVSVMQSFKFAFIAALAWRVANRSLLSTNCILCLTSVAVSLAIDLVAVPYTLHSIFPAPGVGPEFPDSMVPAVLAAFAAFALFYVHFSMFAFRGAHRPPHGGESRAIESGPSDAC